MGAVEARALSDARVCRRSFLARSGAAAVALAGAPTLFSACGSSSSSPSTGSGETASGAIEWIGFQGDDFPKALRGWEARHHIDVKSTYIQAAPDVIAKLKSGAGTHIDVIDFPNNAVGNFLAADLLAPLDESKLPNLDGLFPFLRTGIDHFTRDASDRRIAVPTYVGPFGITYNGKRQQPRSWSDVLQPEYRGKLALFDFPFGNLSIAAVILGYDMGKLTQAQAQQCAALLRRFVKNARTVASTLGQGASLLGSGEVDAVMPDGGLVLGLIPNAQQRGFRTNINPKEGNVLSVELYGMSKTATNPAAALAMMNEVLSPPVNAAAAASIGQAVVVRDAVSSLPADQRKLYPYARYDSFLHSLKLYDNPPAQSSKYVTAPQWLDMYTKLKS